MVWVGGWVGGPVVGRVGGRIIFQQARGAAGTDEDQQHLVLGLEDLRELVLELAAWEGVSRQRKTLYWMRLPWPSMSLAQRRSRRGSRTS